MKAQLLSRRSAENLIIEIVSEHEPMSQAAIIRLCVSRSDFSKNEIRKAILNLVYLGKLALDYNYKISISDIRNYKMEEKKNIHMLNEAEIKKLVWEYLFKKNQRQSLSSLILDVYELKMKQLSSTIKEEIATVVNKMKESNELVIDNNGIIAVAKNIVYSVCDNNKRSGHTVFSNVNTALWFINHEQSRADDETIYILDTDTGKLIGWYSVQYSGLADSFVIAGMTYDI